MVDPEMPEQRERAELDVDVPVSLLAELGQVLVVQQRFHPRTSGLPTHGMPVGDELPQDAAFPRIEVEAEGALQGLLRGQGLLSEYVLPQPPALIAEIETVSARPLRSGSLDQTPDLGFERAQLDVEHDGLVGSRNRRSIVADIEERHGVRLATVLRDDPV